MKRWYLVPDLIVATGQAAIDVLWFYAFVELIQLASPGPLHFDFLSLFGPVAILACIARITATLSWPFPWNRIVLLPLCAAIFVVWLHHVVDPGLISFGRWAAMWAAPWRFPPSVRGDTIFLAGVVGLLLWIRGLWIGIGEVTVVNTTRWLIVGITVLILLCAIYESTTPRDAAFGPYLQNLLLVYFVLGITLTAVVRTFDSPNVEGSRKRPSLSLAGAIAVPVGLIVLIALVFSNGFGWTVSWAMRVAVSFAGLIWSALVWLMIFILSFLRWVFSFLPHGGAGPVSSGRRPRIPHLPSPDHSHWHVTTAPVDVTVVLAITILVVLAVIVVGLIFQRGHKHPTVVPNDERSSLWSWQLFFNQLKGLLRRQATPMAGSPAANIDESEMPEIKVLYRRLLSWGARSGHPRLPSVTPFEYAAVLSTQAPELSGRVAALTQLYVDHRYGDKEITETAMSVGRAVVETFDSSAEAGS